MEKCDVMILEPHDGFFFKSIVDETKSACIDVRNNMVMCEIPVNMYPSSKNPNLKKYMVWIAGDRYGNVRIGKREMPDTTHWRVSPYVELPKNSRNFCWYNQSALAEKMLLEYFKDFRISTRSKTFKIPEYEIEKLVSTNTTIGTYQSWEDYDKQQVEDNNA